MIYRLTFLVFLYVGMGLYGQKPIEPNLHLEPDQHLLRGKGQAGIIALEDGTCFKILPDEAEKVYEEWDHHDYLVLSPNRDFLGGSTYYIENLNKDEYVHVDFHSPADRDDEYTWTIYHIDPYYGEIVASRGSGEIQEWQVEKRDLPFIQEWEKGDRIAIGKNDVWYRRFVTKCCYIMLNCDKSALGYVRTKLAQ